MSRLRAAISRLLLTDNTFFIAYTQSDASSSGCSCGLGRVSIGKHTISPLHIPFAWGAPGLAL